MPAAIVGRRTGFGFACHGEPSPSGPEVIIEERGRKNLELEKEEHTGFSWRPSRRGAVT